MKNTSYLRQFKTKEEAVNMMKLKNKASKNIEYVVVDGYDNNFAVVDFGTAYELGLNYFWSK